MRQAVENKRKSNILENRAAINNSFNYLLICKNMFLTNLSLCKNIVTKKVMHSFSAPTMKIQIRLFLLNQIDQIKRCCFFQRKGT